MEIAAGRLIAPYVGMSLYTWTAIIAVVLAGLSVGHWLGGGLAGSRVSEKVLITRITVALTLATILTLVSLPLLRAIAVWFVDDIEHPIRSVLVLTSALFFLPSLLIGIISPIATKAAIDRAPEQTGRVLGRMFAAGAMGSIFGTLIAGYVFISWIGTIGTVLSVAALYAALALFFGLRSRRAMVMISSLLVFSASCFAWGYSNQAFVSPCTEESDYFCIRIDEFDGGIGSASNLMVLDNLVHSINDQNYPELLYSPYVHFVDELIRLRYPPTGVGNATLKSAFFIGGGGYTLPRSWQHTYPKAKLVVAEIDPKVTDAAVNYLWFDPSIGNVNILHADARVALRTSPSAQKYDVVFGDAFHDISVPAHLVTDQFTNEIAIKLRPGGVYVSNIVDKAPHPMFVFAFVRTLQLHFSSVEVWLEEGVSIDDPRVTYIVLASEKPSIAGRMRAKHGLERAWVQWPKEHLEEQLRRLDPPILTDSYAPVERLLFSANSAHN